MRCQDLTKLFDEVDSSRRRRSDCGDDEKWDESLSDICFNGLTNSLSPQGIPVLFGYRACPKLKPKKQRCLRDCELSPPLAGPDVNDNDADLCSQTMRLGAAIHDQLLTIALTDFEGNII